MKTHLLFICNSAIDRSPTAENLFKNSKKYLAKSAGTHSDATRPVTQRLLDWANIIFVMSEGTNKHITCLKNNFTVRGKRIYDLHVRDMYFKNDQRLIRLLIRRISKVIKF
ncbi:MAG: phosphotyrosine protein phosphatase [bacterium]|nr:phosphotyrosine protein phosphatase [bacterium]